MTRNKLARRNFLVTGAAAVAAPWVIPAGVLGREGATPPSETVRVGLAGLGGRARWILVNEDLPGAKLVAVADCELPRCDQMAAAVAKERPELHPESWKKYADIRQMLDQEKLDAVFVETTTQGVDPAHRGLHSVRPHAEASGGRRRNRPPCHQRLPSDQHLPQAGPPAEVGPASREVRRR